MSVHITVYCTQSLAHLTSSQLWQWLAQADLHLLAEWFGREDEKVVDTALKYLRLEPSRQTSISSFHLYYRPEGSRPIIIERSATGRAVQELVQEELGELADASAFSVERLCAHLARVQEAVIIDVGVSSDSPDMGTALAYEVARWIAKNGEGYVKDDNQAWWMLDGWAWKRVYPDEREETMDF